MCFTRAADGAVSDQLSASIAKVLPSLYRKAMIIAILLDRREELSSA
jgi:hypothetical protein